MDQRVDASSGEVVGVQIERQQISHSTVYIQAQAPAAPARPLHGFVPSSSVSSYISRGDIEQQMRERLSVKGATAIVAVYGPGGVGKSELAKRVANELLPRFADGAYWIDVGGKNREQVIGDMALQFRVIFPAERLYEQRVLELKGHLQQRNSLIVLDDIRLSNASALSDFLAPSPPCAVLVTSRVQQLSAQIPANAIFRLETMDDERARQLLGATLTPARTQAEPEATAQLIERCKGNPLALDIAARKILSLDGVAQPIASFVKKLQQRLNVLRIGDDPRLNLFAVFDISYDELAPADQARFRKLAVFGLSGFSVAAAAFVWGDTLEEASRAIERLLNLSLLRTVEGEEERYRLHHLLDEYAAQRLSEASEQSLVRSAHARYMLELYGQHHSDAPFNVAPEVEAEVENLRAAVNWAREANRTELLESLTTPQRKSLYEVLNVMNPSTLIAKKRDGHALSAEEIQYLVSGFTRGEIPDYQIAAWLMAVYLQGMNKAETVALTLEMAHSGFVLDLSDVKSALSAVRRPPSAVLIADKHSTGGVGDKTTITVAPLVAACGVPIGKMSGRGLGHTGGTLDKLESIPGFRIDLSIDQFKRNLQAVGIVLAGQTHDLAPADGRLYALRDVTATVASMPLIASSIMSKKIAAGADAIVLDVKVGKGAFMPTEAEAVALAQTMVEIGQGVGRRISAVIADMNQPLGRTVGNALEVQEAIMALRPPPPPPAPPPSDEAPTREGGNSPSPVRDASNGGRGRGMGVGEDFRAHCLTVAAEILRLVGRAQDEREAQAILNEAIESGRALEQFRAWIESQGGDARVASDFSILPRAAIIEDVPAPRDGYISGLDALAVGLSAMRLGAGRMKKGDAIDPAVGVVLHKKIGDQVKRGEALFTVHANHAEKLSAEREALLDAFTWSDTPVKPPPHIHRIIKG